MTSRVNLLRSASPVKEYKVKRRKLNHSTQDFVKKLLNSTKGEVIQALHIVFEKESFNFEASYNSNLQNKFICYLNLDGYTFIGYGVNKVAAKSSASRAALTYLTEEFKDNDFYNVVRDFISNPLESNNEDLSIADIIANLVLQKYNELKNSLKNGLPWYKMISGIVMITGDNYQDGKVVALSTGSKCVNKSNVSTSGKVIIDSHAEILCRRAFLYYLLGELEARRANGIFKVVSMDKFELRDDIKFYLYSNSAPCGDCRIFAASNKDNAFDKHPNRICRGILRVKLDGGNSTVPLSISDKYEANDRLVIMSCSDKLLKMNVLGIQGALLSYFIKPIYLSGIVIGDLFHKSHIIRALYGRLEDEEYRINKIQIFGTSKELKVASKSPKTNMNWIWGDSVEILNSVSGKKVTDEVSRLCKYNLFKKFLRLYKDINMKTEKNGEKYSYEYFKQNAHGYQKNKAIFFDKLRNKNVGTWISRNPSLNFFQIDGC